MLVATEFGAQFFGRAPQPWVVREPLKTGTRIVAVTARLFQTEALDRVLGDGLKVEGRPARKLVLSHPMPDTGLPRRPIYH
jgi:hypothetical protein